VAAVQVPFVYYSQSASGAAEQLLTKLQTPPLPFASKLNAVLYINRNCWTVNGREKVMRGLRDVLKAANSSLQLHSFGSCDRNVNDSQLQQFKAEEAKNGGPGQAPGGAEIQVLRGGWGPGAST